MRIRRTAISFLALAGIIAVTGLFLHAKRAHEFEATISYVHFMMKALQVYVEDHKEYPETLDAMTRTEFLESGLPKPPFGSSARYRRPPTNAPNNTPILTVTYRNREIVVTKDFTRTP